MERILMTVIGQVTDRWGRDVALTERNWRHITRRHTELAPARSIVLATIAYPDLVMRDAQRPDRESFYRVVEWHLNGIPRRYIKVCVEYDLVGGTIITAFFSRNIKPGEYQRWP
jgi:hypothetical protein